jgi:hypothetical protein
LSPVIVAGHFCCSDFLLVHSSVGSEFHAAQVGEVAWFATATFLEGPFVVQTAKTSLGCKAVAYDLSEPEALAAKEMHVHGFSHATRERDVSRFMCVASSTVHCLLSFTLTIDLKRLGILGNHGPFY